MQKTITFTDTSELQWAATAYIRRTSLIVRLVVLAVALVAAAVYVRFGDRLGGVAKLLLRFFLAYVAFVFISILWAKLKSKKQPESSLQSRLTFDDNGFGCETDEQKESVAWENVYWVRQEDAFWALHYTVDQRQAFTAIPRDAIDDELAAFILANTPQKS